MNPLRIAFLVNAAAIITIRLAYRRRASFQTVTARAGSGLDAGLLLLAFVAMVPLPLGFLLTDGFAAADYHLPTALGIAGIAITALGTYLFWRSHHDLGLNWSARLQIRAGHELITRGIYRRIRHPMYAAMLVCGLGQPLLLQNWIAGPTLLVVGLVFVALRIPREEALLITQFGDQYRSYMASTGRIVPKLFSTSLP